MILNEQVLKQIIRDILKEQVTQGRLDRAAATLRRHAPRGAASAPVARGASAGAGIKGMAAKGTSKMLAGLTGRAAARAVGKLLLRAVPVVGWALTAVQLGSWLLSKNGGDPEKAAAMVKNNPIRAAAIIRDKAMARGKFPLVIQGGGGPKVKVFDTREELNAHIEKMKAKKAKKTDKGCPAGQRWDMLQGACVDAAAEPDVEPIKISKKRSGGGRKKRCSGKGWGRYKMPANIPYKSFNEFYAALAGNTAALKALGRKDCRWGPKHNKAHGLLKGSSYAGSVATDSASAVAGTAVPKCPPGQVWAPTNKSIGKAGKGRCVPKPKDESLAGLKDDPIMGFSGPGKTGGYDGFLNPRESVESKRTLEEQRYDRLMERLLKEIKKS